MFQRIRFITFALAAGLLYSGCTTTVATRKTQNRSIETLPGEIAADTITVGQFRKVCDMMARSMVVQPFVTQAQRPPVVTIRKIANKTNIKIDENIFQETIRVKLMENAGGALLFRDDESYQDIIRERTRQSSNKINVSVTNSIVTSRGHDRLVERQYEGGSLSGGSSRNEKAARAENDEMKMSQSGEVKSRVADADYFLRGVIYQVKEESINAKGSGMNYFQYQFRLVDARTGLLAWEKMLDSKMAGRYTIPRRKNTPLPASSPTYIYQSQQQFGGQQQMNTRFP
ncbi:MAG: hypothetical protein GY941_26885 [Planctomycetes bacterium]|nr:hypothetical protein [Planctomycetota bacterium]